MSRYQIQDLLRTGWWVRLIYFPFSLVQVFKCQTFGLWNTFFEMSSHFENTWAALLKHTDSYCHDGRLRCSYAHKLMYSVNEHFLFPHKSSHSLLSIRLAQTWFTTHGFNLLSFTFPKITWISNSCSAASVGVEKTCWSPILFMLMNF